MKAKLRRAMAMRLANESATDIERKSKSIVFNLNSLRIVTAAKHIALYSPMAKECQINPLIEIFWQMKKQLYLPKILGGEMCFVAYNPRDELALSALKYFEPVQSQRADPKQLECILIPGLAFDERGKRLGRGKGFYDRVLKTVSSDCKKVGICFAFQVVPAVPIESHDIAMNCIVTEREVICCD